MRRNRQTHPNLLGDQPFGDVYRRFRAPILAYVRRRVRDREAAQDLTQEVFLKAYRARDSYRPEHALSTWLWTIARNVVTDFFRAARGPHGPLDEVLIEPTCPRPGPEAVLARKSERRSLLKLGRGLTRLQKRVVWMRLIHQLSYQEVASRLGLSLSAVKCLAYRSRRILSRVGNAPMLSVNL